MAEVLEAPKKPRRKPAKVPGVQTIGQPVQEAGEVQVAQVGQPVQTPEEPKAPEAPKVDPLPKFKNGEQVDLWMDGFKGLEPRLAFVVDEHMMDADWYAVNELVLAQLGQSGFIGHVRVRASLVPMVNCITKRA